MRFTLILFALCACAPNRHEEVGRPPTMVVSSDKGLVVGEAPTSTAATIAATPVIVWSSVKKAYGAFGIPVTVENPAAHQLGNPNFYKSISFAGQPMASLIDCGNGTSGPNAAKYRIYMSLLTNVSADAKGGTNLQIGFVANGRDVAGNSTETVSCATSGKFEKILIDRIKLVAANGG